MGSASVKHFHARRGAQEDAHTGVLPVWAGTARLWRANMDLLYGRRRRALDPAKSLRGPRMEIVFLSPRPRPILRFAATKAEPNSIPAARSTSPC